MPTMSAAVTGPKLPPEVEFLGVAFSDDKTEMGRRAQSFLMGDPADPTAIGTFAAVATYRALGCWDIEMSMVDDWPVDGINEVRITPDTAQGWTGVAGGVPSAIARALPLRHAQWALREGMAERTVGDRVRPYLARAYSAEGDWARLAHAYVVLKQTGIQHKASMLHKIDPSASVNIWNSRLQKLRDPARKGFLEADGQGDWRMTDSAQVAFSRTLTEAGRRQ